MPTTKQLVSIVRSVTQTQWECLLYSHLNRKCDPEPMKMPVILTVELDVRSRTNENICHIHIWAGRVILAQWECPLYFHVSWKCDREPMGMSVIFKCELELWSLTDENVCYIHMWVESVTQNQWECLLYSHFSWKCDPEPMRMPVIFTFELQIWPGTNENARYIHIWPGSVCDPEPMKMPIVFTFELDVRCRTNENTRYIHIWAGSATQNQWKCPLYSHFSWKCDKYHTLIVPPIRVNTVLHYRSSISIRQHCTACTWNIFFELWWAWLKDLYINHGVAAWNRSYHNETTSDMSRSPCNSIWEIFMDLKLNRVWNTWVTSKI